MPLVPHEHLVVKPLILQGQVTNGQDAIADRLLQAREDDECRLMRADAQRVLRFPKRFRVNKVASYILETVSG